MGCTLSVIPKSPKKGGGGGWVGEQKKPTLVEKWINFREWVRRNHGKKTKVVSMLMKSTKSTKVEAHGERRLDHKEDDKDDVSRRQFSQSEIKVALWLIQHETTMDTRSYSPIPGISTTRTRPKAAKGQRTVLPPLEEQVCLPGAVPEDDDMFAESINDERYLPRNDFDEMNMIGGNRRHIGDVRSFRISKEKKLTKGSTQDCLNSWMNRKLAQQ